MRLSQTEREVTSLALESFGIHEVTPSAGRVPRRHADRSGLQAVLDSLPLPRIEVERQSMAHQVGFRSGDALLDPVSQEGLLKALYSAVLQRTGCSFMVLRSTQPTPLQLTSAQVRDALDCFVEVSQAPPQSEEGHVGAALLDVLLGHPQDGNRNH